MSEDASPICLERLPNEIFDSIAQELRRQDLLNLALTNRDLSSVCMTHLWRFVRIATERDRASVHRALQSHPALAQNTLKLQLHFDNSISYGNQESGEKLYADLHLAARFSSLQHLSVDTFSYEDDPDRSREAAKALTELQHLQSFELRRYHSNGENWRKNDLPALFSLLGHPSMREVTLHHFDSAGGVALTEPRPETSPLTRLSLLNCDVSAHAMSQLLRDCKPRELNYCYWHADQYPPIQTGLDDAQEYIDAMREDQPFLKRLTYSRDFERDEEVPLRFEELASLTHLTTTVFALCGAELPERETTGRIDLSLPPQLEVLEILIFDEYFDWEDEVLPFLRALAADRKGEKLQSLQELHFRVRTLTLLSKDQSEHIRSVGAKCGLGIIISLLPPIWGE